MTFEKALEEIKKNKKLKHKSWNSLMIESFYDNIVTLTDGRDDIYYFKLDEFLERFKKLRNGWVLVRRG